MPARTAAIASSASETRLGRALIRWAASNNIHLAYLTNFVLLASFLGIGIGIAVGARTRKVRVLAPLIGYVADGRNGMKVVQLTSPASQPNSA